MANECKQCGHETSNKAFCDDECKVRWIYQKYIGEQMGTYEMGRMIDYDPKSVYKWLKDNGIPTRPRGTGHEKNPAFTGDKTGSSNPFYGKRHKPESIAKMSESSKGPSPWLRGKANAWYGKKGEMHPTWKDGSTPDRQLFYGTIEWKNVSKEVWMRDDSTCQNCGKKKEDCDEKRFDIHHIVNFDKSKELRADPSNLVLLCHSCHMWIHSKSNIDKKFIKEVNGEC